jgi:hypothetical protein
VKAPPEACAGCGTPAEPGQEYCLDCGMRIVPVQRTSTLGRMWQRRFGRYPGDWIWAALLLLLVAAGSATAGIVAGRDTGGSEGSNTIVATSPVVAAPPTPPAQVPRKTPAPTASTAPAAAPKPRRTLIEWPARDGFTVVLASIPARGKGKSDAEAQAKQALSRGLRDVGVLASSNFASLHPGYYVVFAGVYDSLADAETAAAQASSPFPNAYARQITQ